MNVEHFRADRRFKMMARRMRDELRETVEEAILEQFWANTAARRGHGLALVPAMAMHDRVSIPWPAPSNER